MELRGWGIAILVFAGTAYVTTSWWRTYGGRALLLSLPIQRWPDFTKWDDRTDFALYEAAALWFDAEPQLPMWWRARRKFQRWKSAISSGAVPIKPPPNTSKMGTPRTSLLTPDTRIHRETLKMLAEREGRKPLFLFPERRGRSLRPSAPNEVELG